MINTRLHAGWLFGVVILLSSCAKEFMNPYDPATPPDSWKPRDLQIEPIDRNAVRLYWQQDELHIDGYTVRRDIAGDITEFNISSDSLSYMDVDVIESTVVDTCIAVTYSISARAAENRSDVLTSAPVVFPILTEADAGLDRVFTDNTTQIMLSANSPVVGETGQWSVVSGNSGSFTDASSPTSGFIGQMCTDYDLRWTITGSCARESSDEVSVSFQQQITQANAGQDITGSSLTSNLAANQPAAGETGQWSIVSGTGGSFGNPSVFNTTFTGVLGETYVLRWKITGTCSSSADEVTVAITPAVGDTYQGGIVFYVDGNGGGLIAAAADQSTGAQWGCYGIDQNGDDNTAVPELSGVGSGQLNTAYIVNNCTEAGIAARICNDLTLGGYTDWFLPSVDELQLMYLNLHENGLGGFADMSYWSSTEDYTTHAKVYNFSNGSVSSGNKTLGARVRAVRAF